VVISAPTGSGKSTQVPRWCGGEVVVVEPRRVASRALASRVAELEATELGARVGYQVRGEKRLSEETTIRFVTPGIALRQMELLERAVVVVDEVHERRLDVDLLMALLRARGHRRLVVMSATIEAERIARYVEGVHLEAEGRLFEVAHRYVGESVPHPRELPARVADAMRRAADDPGDVLVFLPGKGEIAAVTSAMPGSVEVVPLHGGLSLDQQSRAFRRSGKRKVILATNVAETSLTVPGIGVVIDSGLVRRTTYHQGRAHLALLPIAADSAAQRAGRAGRTGPGVCYRLWAQRAQLDAVTPPEVHREPLVPLVLAAMVGGGVSTFSEVRALPLLDAPKEHAWEDAEAELEALGALRDGTLTETGGALFGLPLDAHLARLVVEARRRQPEVLQDVVDLVAALAVDRPMFREPPKPHEDPWRAEGCDATGLVRKVRSSERSHANDEARRIARRLRAALGIEEPLHESVDGRALREVAMAADPRCVHVARRRKRKRGERVAFSNGGTELELAKESAAWLRLEASSEDREEAVVVLTERAFGAGRERRLLITCASPCSLHEMRVARLGRERVAGAKVQDRAILAVVERVYAKKVLETREEVPTGELAREALVSLFLDGRVFRKAAQKTRRRLERRGLLAGLSRTPMGAQLGLSEALEAPLPVEEWVRARVATLGFESGDELALLSPEDLEAEPVPAHYAPVLDEHFPSVTTIAGVRYDVSYDLEKKTATLVAERKIDRVPPRQYVPKLGGLRVVVDTGKTITEMR